MATKRAVAQFKFVAQKRPEICSRIQQVQQPVPGCCRCKATIRFKRQPQRQPPHIKNSMSMTEKIARKTQYSLENSVTPLLSDEELKHVYSTDVCWFAFVFPICNWYENYLLRNEKSEKLYLAGFLMHKRLKLTLFLMIIAIRIQMRCYDRWTSRIGNGLIQ